MTEERIYLSPPHVGPRERELLLDAFDSNWVTSLGPHVDGFENDVRALLGVSRAVAVSSGTAALHLALRVLGVRPGDPVLVPSFTFAATANAVAYLGAEPVFVDCDPATWTIDPSLVAAELDRRRSAGRPIRALVTVDLFGQCCDYDLLLPLAAEHGLVVVEDAAEALGSTYRCRPAGTFGDAAVLSFNGNKILTTGGGGMLLTQDPRVADEARYLATQARDPVPHYEHRTVGYNYRMNNLLAAVGRGQLEALADRVAARQATFDRYAKHLASVAGITMMPQASYGTSNCWLTCIVVDPDEFGATAEQVRVHLDAAEIEARPTWKPMHLQPAFADASVVGGAVCESLFTNGLCLPSGSSLTEDDQDRVLDALLSLA
jgi:dTDP-4-amino-4,6-dideoxygalactose transaminase